VRRSQNIGEQSGEQKCPTQVNSTHLGTFTPTRKLLRRLKREDRGTFSKPPHSATLPPLREGVFQKSSTVAARLAFAQCPRFSSARARFGRPFDVSTRAAHTEAR
jgi:hypothetical protein